MSGLSQRLASASTRAWLLAAALTALTVVLLVVTEDLGSSLRAAGPVALILVALGYVAAERFVFKLEYRREFVRVSLSEVPTAFALVFLDPVTAVVTRVLASLAAIMVRSPRLSPLKVAFNAALLAAETAFAAFLLREVLALAGPGAASDGLVVALLPTVIVVASGIGAVFVSVVISLFEGGFRRRLRLEASQGFPGWVLGASLGATAVVPSLISFWLVLVPLVPTVILWRLQLMYGAVIQRYRDLREVHQFSRAVNRSLDLHDVVAAAQIESQRLMRAEFTGLVAFGPGGDVIAVSTTADRTDSLPSHSNDESWREVMASGAAVVRLTSHDGAMRLLAHDVEGGDALAAPVRDAEGILGLLVLAQRKGALERFSQDDVARVEALVDQLAVSLRKSLLHIRLEHEATHDRLTGLPNRALFERSITSALVARESLAVFLLDLDRFKEVNDGLGHHVGDVLLQKFAHRVGAVVGPGAVVSRLAGDEFAIMASGMTRHQAGELGSRILAAAREPFDLGELSVAVSCSIGLALGPAHGRDATTLLRRADLAMYEAKGRSGGVSLYRDDLETTSTQRLRLLQDLRVATVDEQMQAWFQPKIHLRTNAVVGVETLVRWHHPDQGVLEAERFIGLAEQTDLIHTITDRMLTSALVAARSWRRRGWSLGVAVNVSARSLLDELLADRIARHLHQHDVPAELLTIEITETSVMADVTRALVTLDRLSDLGVQLSVDDYGTGYSSLTYLRKLPVSELKIDRGFIANLLTDEHDEVIVRSTIDLGRHLGLRVVAEGIENEDIAARLRDLGCDIGQGSGFAAPLPAAELERWLAAGPYVVPGADGDAGARATA